MIWVVRAGLLLALLSPACNKSRATEADCRVILDRIVEIELHELGYRDALLQSLKQNQLAKLLQDDLDQCVGRVLQPGSMACVKSATETEALSHSCFR
jgi:hypothetical protein